MEIKEPVVISSGPLVAAILHQQANASNNEVGFFLGKVENNITDKISDSQTDEIVENTFINIYDFVPCPSFSSCFENNGKVKRPQLRALLQAVQSKIIGWYIIRRNSSHKMFYREKIIHQNLISLITNDQLKNNFICGLYTSKSSQNGALYSTQHSFYVQKRNRFETLKHNISNLHSDEGNQYKLFNTNAVDRDDLRFKQVMNAVEKSSESCDMVNRGEKFITVFNQSLASLRKELAPKEDELLRLDERIKHLEEIIQSYHLKKKKFIEDNKETVNSDAECHETTKALDATATMINVDPDETTVENSDDNETMISPNGTLKGEPETDSLKLILEDSVPSPKIHSEPEQMEEN